MDAHNLYIEISAHFGIASVENLVANRRNRFINRYGETDNYLCQMLRWLYIYLLRLYNLFVKFTHLCCATVYDGEIKLYIKLFRCKRHRCRSYQSLVFVSRLHIDRAVSSVARGSKSALSNISRIRRSIIVVRYIGGSCQRHYHRHRRRPRRSLAARTIPSPDTCPRIPQSVSQLFPEPVDLLYYFADTRPLSAFKACRKSRPILPVLCCKRLSELLCCWSAELCS